MPDPLFRRQRITAVKIETTPGTAEALLAADAGFPVFDALIQQETEYIKRLPQGAFSPLVGSMGPEGGVATFRTDLVPGSGAVPSWASKLLPACGLVLSGSTYAPVTGPPGGAGGVKTVTIATYQGGLRKLIYGASGNAILHFVNGRPGFIEWTFRGCWSEPTDVAMLSGVTYVRTTPLRGISSALTIGGTYTPRWSELTINLGNQLVLLPDGNSATGYAYCVIAGREPTGMIDPEAPLVAAHNAWNKFRTQAEQALTLTNSAGGIGITLSAPKIQYTSIEEGEREEIQTEQIGFVCNRNADAGDDELTLAFDITP